MLGRAGALWERLHAHLASEFGPLAEKWSFSKTTNRWFALGEKACAAAKNGGLPASVLAVIEAAPRYPEGRGVRLEVRTGKDVANVANLAAIKMAH